MARIRSMTGMCPQHNSLFDYLTCYEHLKLFAVIKNVSDDHVDIQVSSRPLSDIYCVTIGVYLCPPHINGAERHKHVVLVMCVSSGPVTSHHVVLHCTVSHHVISYLSALAVSCGSIHVHWKNC